MEADVGGRVGTENPPKTPDQVDNAQQAHPQDEPTGLAAGVAMEMASHASFAMLDPILRDLLASIERGRKRGKSEGSGRGDIGGKNDHGSDLVALRAQTVMLQRLRENLAAVGGGRLGGSSSSADLSSSAVAATNGLLVMAEYVMLPLTLILQEAHMPPESTQSMSHNSSEWRKYLVRRSAGYACIEQAALCMSLYVELVSGVGADRSIEGDMTSQTSKSYMKDEVVVQCLITCTMAQSNLEESRRYEHTQREDGPIAMSPHTDGLDKGDTCHCAILCSIESLFLAISNRGSAGEKIQAKVASSLGGALLARLVEGCLFALSSVSPTGSFIEGGDRGITNAHVGGEDIRGNVALRLQALSSLRAMITAIPKTLVWRNLLPGSFAVLFRLSLVQLRFSTALSSPKVAAESISTLSRLLDVSLSQDVIKENNKVPCDPYAEYTSAQGSGGEKGRIMSASMALHAMANKSASGAACPIAEGGLASHAQTPKEKPTFLEQVNQRLPAPLVVLMRLVPTHASVVVRRAGAVLYTSVLVHARAVWIEQSEDTLERTAMECCLSLISDSDEYVRSAAERVLFSYRESMDEPSWRNKVGSVMAPRVVELVESLPLLARGMRENELRNQIDVVCGYLQCCLNARFAGKKHSARAASGKGTELGMSLSRVSDVIRKALGDLFRPDYDSMVCSPRVASELIIARNLADTLKHKSRSRYCFLRNDAAVLKATRLLHLLGNSLGEKQGSLFVDGCIAQLFNGAREGTKSTGRGHIHWLDQFCGLVVVAKEVLVSSFPCARQAEESDSFGQGTSMSLTLSSRRQAKREKILWALASSTIPIITSPPIWSLPTTVEMFSDQKGTGGPLLGSINATIDSWKVQKTPGSKSDEFLSVSAFHGNAVMQGYLLGLIGYICQLLRRRTNSLLPTIFLPLLEKTGGAYNHYHVQQTAIETLEKVALATGSRSIASLIADNFDYIVESISLQLRSQTSSHQWNNNIASVLSVVLQSTRDTKPAANDSFQAEDDTIGRRPRTALLFDLVDALIVSFDMTFSLKHGPEYITNTPAVLALVLCFGSTVQFLSASFDWTCYRKERSTVSDKALSSPWLDILAEFEESSQFVGSEPTCPAATEKEQSELEASAEIKVDTFAKSEAKKDNDGRHQGNIKDVSRGVEVTKVILSRCCFFLFIRDLKIQVASCRTLLDGLKFLSSVEEAVKDTADETEGIGNPFLTAVSDCWPAIVSRFSATCGELINDASNTQEHERTTASTASSCDVLFTDLLGLVATACENSGDFLARRFEEEVWPRLSNLLGTYVRAKNGSDIKVGQAGWSQKSRKGQPLKKDRALVSLLSFMCRIFGSEKFGLRIAHLILPLGVMSLPLLSEEGQVADLAMDMYKQMLSRDCDTLWRTLSATCGKNLSSRVLKPRHFENRLVRRANDNCSLAKRARCLLEYADSLPEQPILS